MSDDKQARFSRPREHILLRSEKRRREPKPTRKRKRKGPFPSSSTAEYQTLVKKMSEIHTSAISRTKIFEYPRIHFIIELSDKVSWKAIASSIARLDVSVVEYIDDKTIRVSLKKDAYESFLSNLERNSKYIQNIREIGVFEKIDKILHEEITRNPKGKNWVTIEFSSISGVEDAELVEESLRTWIEKGDHGTLKRSYQSDTMLLLSGFLDNKSIETIVKEVEPLSYVAKIPKMELEGVNGGVPIALSSIIPLEEVSKSHNREPLQAVIVIDSGINRDHRLLSDYIDDTFDYSTQDAEPCSDTQGHGSSVAGLAIYGDDLRKASTPSARVIMVKNFDQSGEINHDVLEVIRQTMDRYRFASRVINLSFNAQGPNPSLTRALDEIIFLNDYVFVVSAGNINPNTIASFLNSGVTYPEYINNQIIYFPADCRNVITVGSHTEYSSDFVLRDYPSPFTRSGFSRSLIKPDIMALGGNFERSMTANGITVFPKQGLGVLSTSHVDDGYVEQFGTSFSSPIVASIVASIIVKRLDFSVFLIKALLISSCDQMLNISDRSLFSETLQGFGKVDKTRAINSQDWRVCYLMQGEFDSNNPDDFHRYQILFPEQADQLEVTVICGKLRTGYAQEMEDYVQLSFKRPGVKLKTGLKRGFRIGPRKCSCSYRERVRVERGSKGPWRVDVYPHFSSLSVPQKIKYGIVIEVSSSKMNDVYTAIIRWIEPQKERILVPAVIRTPS